MRLTRIPKRYRPPRSQKGEIFHAQTGIVRDEPSRPHLADHVRAGGTATRRSEEHTSELQSLMRISYDVFCLKKQTQLATNTLNHQRNTKSPQLRNRKTKRN